MTNNIYSKDDFFQTVYEKLIITEKQFRENIDLINEMIEDYLNSLSPVDDLNEEALCEQIKYKIWSLYFISKK